LTPRRVAHTNFANAGKVIAISPRLA